MDKRLLYVLVLCIGIMVGWKALSIQMGWVVDPPPVVTPVVPAADTGAEKALDAAPLAGTSTTPAAPTKTPISPVIADDAERSETLVVGAHGSPGYYRAVFSNRGAVLAELRSGNYFDKAGLDHEQQADWKHWEVLVSPSPMQKGGLHTLALRTQPSSADLAGVPLETALWTSKLLTETGPDGAPRTQGIEYTLAPGQGVTFKKRFRFVPGTDQVRLEIELHNDAVAAYQGVRNFVLTPATGVPHDSGDSYYSEPQAIAFSRAGGESDPDPKLEVPHFTGDVKTGVLPVGAPVKFAGVFNKYFAVLLRGGDVQGQAALSGASWRAVHDDAYAAVPGNAAHAWRQIETDVDLQMVLPPQGEARTWAFDLYAGPKSKAALTGIDADFAVIVTHDLGFVSGISRILLWILGAFHALTQSWGVAIILLTVTVRAVLFPINRRSQTAMARYQVKVKRAQPRIEEMKKKYEKDPAKLRTEQARIMQEEGALMPPVGGCLPPLLQIPVFLGLYRALGVSFDLRHASFMGWISDLSLPDRLLRLDWHLPLVGNVPYLNVLPPLMVVVWILQQRSMPKPTDPQAATMYKMMMFMPLVMGIFLYNYAAGLSVYMITQSALGIAEQKIIRKYWPVDDTVVPQKKKPNGFMAKLMAAQQEKMKQVEAERAKRKKAAARR